MKLETENLDEYLASDAIVDWKTPEVQQTALDLTRSLANDMDKAKCLYEWVRDAIPHSHDAGLDILTCTASEVLHHRTGICFAKSHLLAALLRAVDIPTGFCYQALCLDPPVNKELVLHGLNAIYLESLKKWIRIDARGNTGPINAQFRIDHEQLAYSTDPSAGEYIYPTVYASPASSVVQKLRQYKSRKDLWLDLPRPF